MASKRPSGLKVPVRPAPAPPPGRPSGLSAAKPSLNLMDSWESFDDSFGDTFSRNGSNQLTAWPDAKKKVPPPRPPPPKVSVSKPLGKNGSKHITKSNSKQQAPRQRPTELLTNLFSRRGQKADIVLPPGPVGLSNKSVTPTLTPVATASLIDLSSPPSSPTPTTRSSSDGLSVDSFGSDGTASHSHHHSQVESGFEDDSDLFGGFTATPSPVNRDPWASSPSVSNDVFSPVSSSTSSSKNPWSTTPQDPFSPPRKFSASPTPAAAMSVPAPNPAPGAMAFKPTIIRPKVKPNSSPSISRSKSNVSPLPNTMDDDDRSESPPMPSIPPPAPPPELFTSMDSVSSGMENLSILRNKDQGTHCIALYDYESSHPDDLTFKEGTTIELVEGTSGEWLRGRINGKEGLFPASFVNVSVSSPDTGGVFATALFSFTPETWEDLELHEGEKVCIISRINSDWLYGECNGKQGQFPSTFVDNVPSSLPMRS